MAHPQYTGKGRPRKNASPATYQWPIVATVTVNQQVDQEAACKACWIVGTKVLDPAMRSDQALVTTYKEQGGVERGFRFLRISRPSRVLRLCQETGADHGAEFHHGAVPADLSLSRISVASPPGLNPAD